jgi:chitin biosynthesis protein CHS5
MKKDFKFPDTQPSASAPPPVPPFPTNESKQVDSEVQQTDVAVKGYEVAPQEVPPPPPVEKETAHVVQEEDTEDEVGPTVEVDLS